MESLIKITAPRICKRNHAMFLIFIFALSVCDCATDKGYKADTACSYIQNVTRPAWINGDSAIDGCYVGVGQAEKNGLSTEEQHSLAKINALADLAQNIRVHVKSDIHVQTVENVFGSNESVNKHSRSRVRVTTDITLSDAADAGSWLDEDNCIMYARIKVKRELVDNLLTLNSAEKCYLSAKNSQNKYSR